MGNNRTRILSEIIALDAWHAPFRIDGNSSGVFVELSFQEGRIGGDNSAIPFTFKVSLKKALLTVTLESPLEIDRASIARSVPEAEIELTKIKTAKDLAEASLIGKAKISPAALHIALNGSAKTEASVSQEDQLRLVQTIPETMVTPRPRGSRGYSWEMEPSFRPNLRGQPWDPITAPRLKVKSLGKLQSIDPAIKVEIRCALEDLDISDIKKKQSGINGSIRNILYNEISEAAAIQHLKLILRDADLEAGELDNRFSGLILANVLAVPQ